MVDTGSLQMAVIFNDGGGRARMWDFSAIIPLLGCRLQEVHEDDFLHHSKHSTVSITTINKCDTAVAPFGGEL